MTQFRNVDDNEGVNLVGPVWLEEGGQSLQAFGTHL